ncbi:MAG: bifunctional 4'-phosphopantothenoylcysteine decarboxylase/phosphopantothenoylcysteine synthetase, partial [Megasphaera sp.]|nr:bifunctional 4'-phosphopantothenoylcysteine decarboxylase/phosphopantothenoylcysteine synthetase [Megasphaera sp.]
MLLNNKKVILAVCGGIAAFKAAEIASLLCKRGAEVKCIMTENAAKFITPLTLREITGNPVTVSMWNEVTNWHVEHIALASWADVFLIAPATANCIGKIAGGIADDMLTTTVMATKAPVVIAPAMNTNMYLNPIVQHNMEKLKKYG